MFETVEPATPLTDADRFVALVEAARVPRRDAVSVVADWAVPGVPRPRQEVAASTPLSPAVQALVSAVDAVLSQVPSALPGPQALSDTAALLAQADRLRAGLLSRVADVDTRRLHTLDGAASTGTWLEAQQTSVNRGDVALARRLATLPRLAAAVEDGALSVETAGRVGKALVKLRRHLDRPDGLIDGQDGEQAVRAVVCDGVRDAVCTALGGLADDDARLVDLVTRLAVIADQPATQLIRLEATFVLLGCRIESGLVASALSLLVDALLPNELDRRAEDAHAERGFTLLRSSDGSGWHVTDGRLDLETGELLHTVLQAEADVDPHNPADTTAYQCAREQGWRSSDGPDALPACGRPRSLRQRRHDALRNALRRYLDSGAMGLRDKVAPHLSVTVPLAALNGEPGATPAVTASGSAVPSRLLRRWSCDSAVTRFVLSLGRKVLETSHTERTLTAFERRAKRIETGGVCQALGCTRGPGTTLVPHHITPWARTGRTSLDDTALICEQTHHDLHSGKHRIRLKDGRWIDEHGEVDGPPG